MIQDISPQQLSIEYTPREITDSDLVFCFKEGQVLCGNGFSLPLASQMDCSSFTYLFSVGKQGCFLAFTEDCAIPEGFEFENTNVFRGSMPKHVAFAGMTARHLCEWYEANRYCGHCREPMSHDQNERMLKCPSCGNRVYPAIAPVVIVAVSHGNKLLLTKFAGGEYRNYALVSGFIEIGESAEDAVRREVMEETGVSVKGLRYYKSQPWGFSNSLLLGFCAELDGSPVLTVDKTELSEAVWVEREDIETTFDDYSLTNEMICHFKGLI
ncbi:MAG: NAD(+) diphosphatase [Eubacteriaceae bacterium]|nr:NAD(+) diphosphatase [Eubacteriaceae bacterium]